MSSRQALLQGVLTWLGLLGTDRTRIFAAPDLRAAWALLTACGVYVLSFALIFLLHTSLIVGLVLACLLLVASSLLLAPQGRPLMFGLAVLLFLFSRVPGFAPVLFVLPVVGLFVGLRYLSRHSSAALYDAELGALSSVFGTGWKAYLPVDPDAQAQVRVLVSPEQQTFFLGVVAGRAETKYGTPHVVWTGLTAERLQAMALRDTGVVQTSQKVLWVIQPSRAEGRYDTTLEHGVATVIAPRTGLGEQLNDWSLMRANLDAPPQASAQTASEQGRRVEAQATEELQGLLPPGWVMRTGVLLAQGGDADIELTTGQRTKYVIDVKSRSDRMNLQAPRGDRAKSWAEIHAQVVGAARQLQGVPVVWQPLAKDEDFLLVGDVWCLRGPARTLIEALNALEQEELEPDSSPHQILGVQPGATKDEIQAAYKRLAKQYHPDRVASLGEEFRHLAERRMKVINAAYQALMG